MSLSAFLEENSLGMFTDALLQQGVSLQTLIELDNPIPLLTSIGMRKGQALKLKCKLLNKKTNRPSIKLSEDDELPDALDILRKTQYSIPANVVVKRPVVQYQEEGSSDVIEILKAGKVMQRAFGVVHSLKQIEGLWGNLRRISEDIRKLQLDKYEQIVEDLENLQDHVSKMY